MVNKKVAISNLIIYIFVVAFYFFLSITGTNFLISLEKFNYIHVAIETTVSIFAFSIFLIVFYTHPYERKQKYVVPGSIFLSISIINIMHIYFSFKLGEWAMGIVLSNLTYYMISLAIMFNIIIPDDRVAEDKEHFFYIPLFFITISFLFYILSSNSHKSIFVIGKGFTKFGMIFELIIMVSYFYTLHLSTKKFLKNKNMQNVTIMNCIMFSILSKYMIILHEYPNDIFCISGHFTKLIAYLFFVKGFLISNVQKPYKKLEEANNIKSDFLINLSHELRTPVNIILNASRLVSSNPEKYSSFISYIENNAYRLSKLSDNLIIFNEIENGKINLNFSKEDIVVVIDEIIESAEGALDKKNADLVFEFSGKRDFIIDREKFVHIFSNLLSNSIKYVNQGGSIYINLEIEDYMLLTILNDGPPIKDDSKIFDKFYKIKDDNLSSTEGLGIGLYIAKTFANMLNGDIKILNESNLTGYLLMFKPIENVEISDSVKSIETTKNYFSDIF